MQFGEPGNRRTEIHLGCRLQPVCVVPEKNRIDVALKNLAFGNFLFQHRGVSRLQHLVSSVSIEARKELVFHDLLRDGGRTLAR